MNLGKYFLSLFLFVGSGINCMKTLNPEARKFQPTLQENRDCVQRRRDSHKHNKALRARGSNIVQSYTAQDIEQKLSKQKQHAKPIVNAQDVWEFWATNPKDWFPSNIKKYEQDSVADLENRRSSQNELGSNNSNKETLL